MGKLIFPLEGVDICNVCDMCVRYCAIVRCFLKKMQFGGLDARESFYFFENLLYILQARVLIRLRWYYDVLGIVLKKKEVGSWACMHSVFGMRE